MDCYINLIKAQEHLKCRYGGRVHIENAFQFNFVKREDDIETKIDELHPIKDITRLVFTCILFLCDIYNCFVGVYPDKHPRNALVSCRHQCKKYGDTSARFTWYYI